MFKFLNPFRASKILPWSAKDKGDAGSKAVKKKKIPLNERFKDFTDFLLKRAHSFAAEYHVIRKKLKNLAETNYRLGIYHMQNDNLGDATTRFRIVKRFWPEYYDAYYQLAYCLVLRNKFYEAKAVLVDLLGKKNDFTKAHNLMHTIEKEISVKEASGS